MPSFSILQVHNAHDIASCGSLASLLEVSSYPKPGNVHRTRDFPDTRYEHFLAAAIAIYPALFWAATQAIQGAYPEEDPNLLGEIILAATRRTQEWQSGGNVNFGEVLLFAPLTIAMGACVCTDVRGLDELRAIAVNVVAHSTVEDAALTYQAFQVVHPGSMGSRQRYDVTNPDAVEEIRQDGMTFKDCFLLNPDTDDISAELTGTFTRTFLEGIPTLTRELARCPDTNAAIVNTFLFLLAQKEDSLIIRKAGHDHAVEIQSQAGAIMDRGGMANEIGKAEVQEFDGFLQKEGGKLNPGTTADILGATLFVACACGLRP